MFDSLLQIIAPHHCYLCQNVGVVLCNSCIYNIVNDNTNVCIECMKPSIDGVCNDCKLPFAKAWYTASREDEIKQVLHDFKWNRMYRAYQSLAALLDSALPLLPSETVIVPVPTIASHIRIRGYDHIDLVAAEFAKLRSLRKQNLLVRKHNYVQHSASKQQRRTQANDSFECRVKLRTDVPYLILDDIYTTGATTKAATGVLKRADAREVWVAAIARQPLHLI